MKNRKLVILACLCLLLLSACQNQSTVEAKVKFEDFKTIERDISWNSTKQDIKEAYTTGTMEENGNKLYHKNILGQGQIEESTTFSFSDDEKLEHISDEWSFASEKMALLMYRGTIDGLKEMYGEPKIVSQDSQTEMVTWNTQIEDTRITIMYDHSQYTGKYFYFIFYNNERIRKSD